MRLLAGKRYKDKLARPLAALGADVIWLPDDPALDPRLAGHADLLAFVSGRQIVAAPAVCSDNGIVNYLTNMGYTVHTAVGPRGSRYPADVGLCACETGKYSIFDPETVDPAILDHLCGVPVTVSQGYTKCAACVVNDHSIITSDAGVSRASKKAGLDVLDIQPGYIALDGYDHGFIGGASFMLEKNVIAFTGTMDRHPDKERILDFLKKHGRKAVFLTRDPIFDIGGALALP